MRQAPVKFEEFRGYLIRALEGLHRAMEEHPEQNPEGCVPWIEPMLEAYGGGTAAERETFLEGILRPKDPSKVARAVADKKRLEEEQVKQKVKQDAKKEHAKQMELANAKGGAVGSSKPGASAAQKSDTGSKVSQPAKPTVEH